MFENRKNIRTDLAIEEHELFKQQKMNQIVREQGEPPGVEVEYAGNDDIKISRVKVVSPQGEQSIGKPMGNYITLEIPGLRYRKILLYYMLKKTAKSPALMQNRHL